MKILFTGGGTGGHFYPIIAVAKALKEESKKEKILPPELYFMSPDPYDERVLFENNITFLKTPAGKIRRYFSIRNIVDSVKTIIGVIRAIFTVFTIYPDVIFGKGGYGSFPALFAGRLFRIPVVIHESDSHPGRVNLWASKFAKRIAISYPDAIEFFPREKTAYTGNPVRPEVIIPITEGAPEFLKLEKDIPVILVLGGSQGAQAINEALLDTLPNVLEKFQVIHQTGEKNFKEVSGTASVILENHQHKTRYMPFPYLNELALRMSYGVSSLIITRAGSTLFEIALIKKPSIVVPIPEEISHDQLSNAFSFARSGGAVVIEERNLTPHVLEHEIMRIMEDKALQEKMSRALEEFAPNKDSAQKIAHEILSLALKHEE